MNWSWVFFGALALVVTAYILYEGFIRRLRRAGSPQALVISAYRKSFERAERRRKAKRKRLLQQAGVLERILETQPGATSVRESLIKLYLAEARVEPLKRHALVLLRRQPRNGLALSTSIALVREDDFFDDARKVLKDAIEESPDDLVLLQNYVSFLLGRLGHESSDQRESTSSEAESFIARLLQASPESAAALWSHAVLLRYRGQLEQAATELLKIPSPQPSFLLQLGEIFTQLEKPDEAVEAYRRAAEKETEALNGVGAVANIAYCKLGLINLLKGDEGAAAGYLRDAIPAVPRVVFWRDGLDMELAEDLFQRGLAVDAVNEYVSVAIAYKPDDRRAVELKEKLSATA